MGVDCQWTRIIFPDIYLFSENLQTLKTIREHFPDAYETLMHIYENDSTHLQDIMTLTDKF